MTPVSPRYLPHVVALLALALAPVFALQVRGPRPDPCADPEALRDVAPIPGSVLVEEHEAPELEGVFQWTEGGFADPDSGGRRMAFHVVRSTDPRTVYEYPTSFVAEYNEVEPYRASLEWIQRDGERLPVWWVRVRSLGLERVVAYTFVFDGRPVAHPVRAQLASAVPQLLEGRLPMTLLLADGYAARNDREGVEAAVASWLARAWRRHREVCGSGSGSAASVSATAPRAPFAGGNAPPSSAPRDRRYQSDTRTGRAYFSHAS